MFVLELSDRPPQHKSNPHTYLKQTDRQTNTNKQKENKEMDRGACNARVFDIENRD